MTKLEELIERILSKYFKVRHDPIRPTIKSVKKPAEKPVETKRKRRIIVRKVITGTSK